MAAVLLALAPPRARAGASLVLTGTGFAPSGNTVKVDGIAAAVGAESSTSITVTVPGGIRTDRFVPVEVTHATDASVFIRQWWSKATAAELQAFVMAFQQPGDFEDWGAASSQEHPEDIEAKDIEGLHELLQYLPIDVLTTPGDMAGRNDNGVGRITNGPIGSTVMLDHSTGGGGSGINHRTRRSGFLTWGRSISSTTPELMAANGTANQGSSAGAEQRSPDGGFATRLVVYVDRQGGTRELDRVEVLVDGAVLHDSGAGLGLAAQQQYTANVWSDLGTLATGSRISIRLTMDGGTSSVDCVAALMVF